MSRAARDWAWTLSVTPVQKLVITALAERADDEGRCFPSLAHLTRMTGLARSTVVVALQELEAARRIVRVRGGGRKSTWYRLFISEPDAMSRQPRAACADQELSTEGHFEDFTPGPPSGAGEKPVVRDADPSSPGRGPQQSGSRTAPVPQPDSSSPTGGRQQSDRRTSAVREPDPRSPSDGLVRELVVRQTDPSGPGAGPQQSGRRTAVVRQTDPNRQYNHHLTVSESTADVVDARRRDHQARDAPKATPIPADWRPSERVLAWAAKQGMARDWVEAQIDEFVVYWTDTGEARKSWDATFINRLQALRANQPKEQADEPEPRLADKDYLTGATPLDQIP